jgi:hypothetical protein
MLDLIGIIAPLGFQEEPHKSPAKKENEHGAHQIQSLSDRSGFLYPVTAPIGGESRVSETSASKG